MMDVCRCNKRDFVVVALLLSTLIVVAVVVVLVVLNTWRELFDESATFCNFCLRSLIAWRTALFSNIYISQLQLQHT